MAQRKSPNFCNVDLKQLFDYNQVEKLYHAKSKYGQLFLFRRPNFFVVCRPLTMKECTFLTEVSEALDNTAVEDWIFSKCFILGSNTLVELLNNTPYTFVSEVSGYISEHSTKSTEKDYIAAVEEQREIETTYQYIVESIIYQAFPTYKDDKDVSDLTQTKQFELLAKAENISGNKLDFVKPKNTKNVLRQISEGAHVIGGEDITSPAVADKPDFNESI